MARKRPRVQLPPPCRECRPNDGAWRVDAATGGLERCDCPRGKALASMRRGRLPQPKATPPAKPKPYDGRLAGAGKDGEE